MNRCRLIGSDWSFSKELFRVTYQAGDKSAAHSLQVLDAIDGWLAGIYG